MAKHNLYEGGIRVTHIMKWPNRINREARNSYPEISNDFYPTFLYVTNSLLEPSYHKDGVSLKDILLGNQQEFDREVIYWYYPHSRFEGPIRMGDYKLIYFYKTGKTELYNLIEDIGETQNLAEGFPELQDKMLLKLKLWLKEVSAKFPEGMEISKR